MILAEPAHVYGGESMKTEIVETKKPVTISKQDVAAFQKFLKKNEEYLKNSAGVFHTDNHGNW